MGRIESRCDSVRTPAERGVGPKIKTQVEGDCSGRLGFYEKLCFQREAGAHSSLRLGEKSLICVQPGIEFLGRSATIIR